MQRSIVSLSQPNESPLVTATDQPSNAEEPTELEANEIKEMAQGTNHPAHAKPLYHTLLALLNDCDRTAKVFKNGAAQIFTEEATQAQSLRYMTLLRHLRAIEEGGSDLSNADAETNALHLRVYDALIQIAPSFRHRNATLEEMLKAHREIFMRG